MNILPIVLASTLTSSSPMAPPSTTIPSPSPSSAKPKPAQVFFRTSSSAVRVVDGDTVEVDLSIANNDIPKDLLPKKFKIRLRFLDCPESKQPGGDLATAQAMLLMHVQGGLSINIVSTDKYGRFLGDVFLGSYTTIPEAMEWTTSLGFALVNSGYCFPYRNSGPYKPAMNAAVAAQRGPLWDGRYKTFCEPNTQVAMKSGATKCIIRDQANYMKRNCSTPHPAPVGPLPPGWCMEPRTPPWVWRKSLTEIR